MAYSPPLNTDISFNFTEVYSAPAQDSIQFDFGTGITTLSLPAFNLSDDFSVGIVWYTILSDFDSASLLGKPDVILQVSIPDLGTSDDLSVSSATRVKLADFEGFSDLFLEYINYGLPGVEMVGPPPFETRDKIDKPVINYLIDLLFNTTCSLEQPVILLDGNIVAILPDFNTMDQLHVDQGYTLSGVEFSENPELELYAIVSMPEGDQYTKCVPFETSDHFDPITILQFVDGVEFNSGDSFEVGNIYFGPLIIVPNFETTDNIEVNVEPVILLNEFNCHDDIEIGIQPGVVIEFDDQSTLELEDIFSGDFVELSNFESRDKIELLIFSDIALPDFDETAELELEGVYQTILLPEFETADNFSNNLDIKLFGLDTAKVFYYCVISHPIGDLEVPFINFQARRRNGTPTYIQVTIPSTDYANDLADRVDGKIQIFIGYNIDKDSTVRFLIAEAAIKSDGINIYNGPTKQSIVIIGQETFSYTPRVVNNDTPIYKSVVSGKTSYRFAVPKFDLQPGDTLKIGTDTIVVDYVSMYVKNTSSGPVSNMEVFTT